MERRRALISRHVVLVEYTLYSHTHPVYGVVLIRGRKVEVVHVEHETTEVI